MFRIFSSLIDSFFGEAKPETPPEAKTTPPSVQPKMHTGLANAIPNAAKEELDDANEAEITCFGQIPHHNTDPDQSNRYPMRESPIPCAGINYVLRTQAELIQKIKVAVPLNEPDKDRFLFPVIRNIAAYVHLLPASNNYHHKGRGGLLRHSLEVGLYTVNMGRMHIFDQKADPEAKYRNKGRWFLACFLRCAAKTASRFGTRQVARYTIGSKITTSRATTSHGAALRSTIVNTNRPEPFCLRKSCRSSPASFWKKPIRPRS